MKKRLNTWKKAYKSSKKIREEESRCDDYLKEKLRAKYMMLWMNKWRKRVLKEKLEVIAKGYLKVEKRKWLEKWVTSLKKVEYLKGQEQEIEQF